MNDVLLAVIPERVEEANPETRDSGFDAFASPRNDDFWIAFVASAFAR